MRMHDDEVHVDDALVRLLLTTQLPHLAAAPLTAVEPWGTDNAIWRLGDDLVVRLPRVGWAAEQPRRDAAWLPRLAPHLPVAIPTPVAVGQPGHGYPYEWSVHQWIAGELATLDAMSDPVGFAVDMATFVSALWTAPTDGAPPARNRALPLADYDDDAREVIANADGLIDSSAALAIWEEALAASEHCGPPLWVQGDLEGNCLVRDGRLCGVVDWGSACVGDPAVDVAVVWSPLFTARSRDAFLTALDVDEATVTRSKGAAVQQACAALPYYLDTYPLIVERSWHKLDVLGVGRR